jgi:hypothetical protein
VAKVKTRRPPKPRTEVSVSSNSTYDIMGAPDAERSSNGLAMLLKAAEADPTSFVTNDHSYCTVGEAGNTVYNDTNDKDKLIADLQRKITNLESVICKQSDELKQLGKYQPSRILAKKDWGEPILHNLIGNY